MRKNKLAFLVLLIFSLALFLSGCSSTTPTNQSPNARFSANPTSGKPPLEVSFDASESSDPDGEIIEYVWDFGDGGYTNYGETEDHEYENTGNYTAKLTVTDDEGASDSAQVSITVTSGPTDSTVDYRVTVTEIINEFDDNKLAAKEKYKGSTIAITGNVSTVDTSYKDYAEFEVHLNGTWVSSWYGVVCYFPEGQKDELLELSEGDRITVVGDYDTWNGLNAVWIKYCYFEG